jgi:Icc protein
VTQGAAMSDQPVRILQVSDPHLMADARGELLGVNTQASLEAVFSLAKTIPFDLLLLTGDLSQDYSEPAYRRLAQMVADFHVPVYCIPGNHDDVGLMMSVYPLGPISMQRHILLKSWQIILLNSQKPGKVPGRLDQSQLSFLAHCLETYPEHDAMVVFHHHIMPIGSAWLDKLGVENPDEFWQVAKRFPKIKLVVMGHVHQASEHIVHGIPCYTVPSTCIQFKRNQDHFGLEELPPGCRLITLHASGFFETEVLRVPSYVGVFDKDAKGY